MRRLLTALTVVGLLATGCGDDDDTDVRSTVPTTTDAPATTATSAPTTSAPDLDY